MNDKDFLDGIYKKYNNQETLNDKFYRQKLNKRNHVPLYIVAVCIFAIAITSSIGFADNYLNFFNKSGTATVKINEIEMAIKDNYIQNVDMEYCKSKKIGVKVDSISMDNTRLYIVLDFKFDKSLQENFDDLIIQDMLITDDNDDLIFCNKFKIYENYCNDNNIDITQKTIFKTSFKTNLIEKTHNTAKYIYYFNTEDSFPESKKININFHKLKLLNYSTNFSNNKVINGNWKIELNLEDSFYNKKSTIYTSENIDDMNDIFLNINNITTTLVFNKNSDYNIEDVYIIDEDNKKYVMRNINISDSGKITINFDLINNINFNTLTLHIKTNNFEKDIILNRKQD